MKNIYILLLSFCLTLPLSAQFQGGDASGYDCGLSDPTFLMVARDAPLPNATLRIFPNPSKGTVYWEGANLPIQLIEVLDLQGKTIFTKRAERFEQSIELREIPSGSYLLRLKNQEKAWVKPLILLE